jgi:hypothetical protein
LPTAAAVAALSMPLATKVNIFGASARVASSLAARSASFYGSFRQRHQRDGAFEPGAEALIGSPTATGRYQLDQRRPIRPPEARPLHLSSTVI